MSPEIVTINTPMGVDHQRGDIPYETLYADLDGDGVDERVEVETAPRLEGVAFREWRVFREGATTPVGIAAGIDISIRQTQSGAPVLVSDGALWRIAENEKMYPYSDLVMSRSDFVVMGTKEDQHLLHTYGATGIFRENVRTIAIQIGSGRGQHRVIAGGGFAFMDEQTETFLFIISDPQHNPLIIGRSASHPWLFRTPGGFTMISESIYGHQISLIPEGIL